MATSAKKINENLQDIAVRIAYHCVRNTIIEDYHADGKISDSEMKAFNKEVANKIYTILQMLTTPHYKEIRNKPYFFKDLFYKPADWDLPEIDSDFTKAVEIWEKMDKEKSEKVH